MTTPPRPTWGLLRRFPAFRHRNYRLFWFGQLVSRTGTWMQSTGQAWLVLTLTHSAWQLSLVGALQALPLLLFSLMGGVLADRWPKRRVLLCTQGAAMAQALVFWLLIVSGSIQVWQIYVLALLLGLSNSLGWPVSQAFTVELVGRADLPNAVALNASFTNLTRMVGPGLGGIILAAGGSGTLFLLNALSFLAILGALALISSGDLQAQAQVSAAGAGRQTSWQSLREALGYVGGMPSLLLVIGAVGLVLFFGSNFTIVLPLLSTNVLHSGPTGFGFLSAALGAGALLGALLLAWDSRQPTPRAVLRGTTVFGALECVFALSHLYGLSLLLIAGLGAVEAVFAAQAITLLQLLAPDHLRGRVMSVCVLVFDGSVPPGYLLVGWLAGSAGVSAALLIGGALCLLVSGAGWLWQGRL
jgi:MFS family permease